MEIIAPFIGIQKRGKIFSPIGIALMISLALVLFLTSCHSIRTAQSLRGLKARPLWDPVFLLSVMDHTSDSVIIQLSPQPSYEYDLRSWAIYDNENLLLSDSTQGKSSFPLRIALTTVALKERVLYIESRIKDRVASQYFYPLAEAGNTLNPVLVAAQGDKSVFLSGLHTGIAYTFYAGHKEVIPHGLEIYDDAIPLAQAPVFDVAKDQHLLKGNFSSLEVPAPFIIAKPGIYRLRFGDEWAEKVVYVGDAAYPALDSALDLAETMRYITRNKEYDSLLYAASPATAIDRFWLKRGGSFERGKTLMEEFYSRVEWTNRYLTTDRPGWMTDKGMIFIIFGLPDRIEMTPGREKWYYQDPHTIESLEFDFISADKYWMLERNQNYRDDWDAAVYFWRNGEIRNPKPLFP